MFDPNLQDEDDEGSDAPLLIGRCEDAPCCGCCDGGLL